MKKDDLIITESTNPLNKYFVEKEVFEQTKEKLNTTDILAVPIRYDDGEYYYAQETISFLKYCRQTDPEHSADVLSDGDIKLRSLHSFDIWMPVIWIGSSIVLPLVINLVSNYIWEKMRGREQEDAKVNITIMVQQGKNTKELHYNGDARTFSETFEKIDITKL
ncbi:hypothetical protein [Syntrophomonas wolfei]|uniref:hypothetical protein n=1 Tax=Syntrophomonas wolfei TaxID=863 RepID=UPI000774B622|nr:hypothetical protein [Syntrophomonas wolfei]